MDIQTDRQKDWLRSGSQIKASPGLDIKLAHYYCVILSSV